MNILNHSFFLVLTKKLPKVLSIFLASSEIYNERLIRWFQIVRREFEMSASDASICWARRSWSAMIASLGCRPLPALALMRRVL